MPFFSLYQSLYQEADNVGLPSLFFSQALNKGLCFYLHIQNPGFLLNIKSEHYKSHENHSLRIDRVTVYEHIIPK